jgi:hypothetical protein
MRLPDTQDLETISAKTWQITKSYSINPRRVDRNYTTSRKNPSNVATRQKVRNQSLHFISETKFKPSKSSGIVVPEIRLY